MNTRMKEVRKAYGLNQTEFGKRIGVSQSAIAAYESGVRTPLDAVILAISKEFKISQKWLLTGEGDMAASKNREEEIAEIVSTLYNAEEQPWLIPIVNTICKLDPDEWDKIADVAEMLVEARKNKDR